MKFLDEARVHVQSGDGGAGCLSFRREKFIERGGPNGGDGGRGGDVVVLCVDGLNTLVDFRYGQHFKAKKGRPGEGRQRTGAAGEGRVLEVPVGTEILDDADDSLLADMTEPGQRVVLARGGDGGFGNLHFKSATNRAPRRADPGWPGEELTLHLRLKLIADAGLLGLPNAGKSTLLARTSRARPKIADYPFTTLHPQLGVVGVDETEFVLADLPGLIEGAHSGVGLGDRFLAHVERCKLLVHLVDGTAEDMTKAYATIRNELAAYGHDLIVRPEIVALNKCDALDEGARTEKRAALEAACGSAVAEISAVTGEGVTDLLRRVVAGLEADRAAEAGTQALDAAT